MRFKQLSQLRRKDFSSFRKLFPLPSVDKTNLDIEKVKIELNRGLNEDYYLDKREWPYKNVPRKIIAEQFMVDTSESSSLRDYKFMCFDGKVKCSFFFSDRNTINYVELKAGYIYLNNFS